MDSKYLYYNDVKFHRVVDCIEQLFVDAQFTPAEMRAAVELACTHHTVRLCKMETHKV